MYNVLGYIIVAVLAYAFGWWWRGFNVSGFIRKHLGEQDG